MCLESGLDMCVVLLSGVGQVRGRASSSYREEAYSAIVMILVTGQVGMH